MLLSVVLLIMIPQLKPKLLFSDLCSADGRTYIQSDGKGDTEDPDILLHVQTNGNVPYVVNLKQNAQIVKTETSCP